MLVGRFQPFHAGHLGVVKALRAQHTDEVLIIGIGSAEESHTWLNPFTAGERHEMIERALRAEHISGWTTVPLVDIHRHALWVAHLESLLPPFERVYTNNPLTRSLFAQAEYEVESPTLVDRNRYEGAKIRELMADHGAWSELLPPPTAAYLKDIGAEARLAVLRPATSSPRSR
ncbi:MAG: nicotinamide-nucleotide adenylyltransferase [Thermoplasmata archaeon]|nr:nicotinamide-nucleotide adenylyltransferase [Thermoplasmata archaeon]